jgi:hypothetical protein
MTLTDLGQLDVGMKCMEHRSMSFLSRVGTLVGARDDAWVHRGSAAGAGSSRDRQVASGHTARGAWPAIFTLVSNIDMGTSFRVDEHHGASPGCRSSEFRVALDGGRLTPVSAPTVEMLSPGATSLHVDQPSSRAAEVHWLQPSAGIVVLPRQ